MTGCPFVELPLNAFNGTLELMIPVSPPPRTNRRLQQVRRPGRPVNTPCGYCFSEWATVWDHIIPWIYGGGDTDSNLYPSCKRCNSLLSSKVFDSLKERREYVRQKLIARGQWDTRIVPGSELQEEVYESQTPKILFPEVPVECVVAAPYRPTPKRKVKVKRWCHYCGSPFNPLINFQMFCSPMCKWRSS